ncbi:MAG: hypothetical protein K1X51_13590 [Rhodospirillaceae bacterium]|nr:hypothetical protein [Rhodospirillaceae bacterium]
MHAILGGIARPDTIHVWVQGAVVFASPDSGEIRVFGFQHQDGQHPWMAAFIRDVAGRVAVTQDNQRTSLSAIPDPPDIVEAKRQNRLIGLHCASALRRWARTGIAGKTALEVAAKIYALPASNVAILIKLANEARRTRVERLRASLIRRWHSEKIELAEIARRLKLSLAHARRLRKFAIEGL